MLEELKNGWFDWCGYVVTNETYISRLKRCEVWSRSYGWLWV